MFRVAYTLLFTIALSVALTACDEVLPLEQLQQSRQLTDELLLDAYLTDDGSHSVTLSPQAIRLFSNKTAKQTFFYDLTQIDEPQRLIALSQNDRVLASAGHQTVHLYLPESGQKTLSWRAKGTVEHAKICAIELSFSGDKILVGFTDGSVSVTNLKLKNQVLYKPHQSDVLHLAFSQHEQSILTAANDGQLSELSLASGEIIEQISFPSRVTAFTLSKNSRQIFAADALSNEKFGAAQGLNLSNELSYVERNRYFRQASFIADKPLLVTSGAKTELTVWDLNSKKALASSHILAQNGSSTTKAIANVKDAFLTLSSDGVLQHWRLPSKQ